MEFYRDQWKTKFCVDVDSNNKCKKYIKDCPGALIIFEWLYSLERETIEENWPSGPLTMPKNCQERVDHFYQTHQDEIAALETNPNQQDCPDDEMSRQSGDFLTCQTKKIIPHFTPSFDQVNTAMVMAMARNPPNLNAKQWENLR